MAIAAAGSHLSRQQIVNSDLYQNALNAMIDYDSTPAGQAALRTQIEETISDEGRRSLQARLIAGAFSRDARKEQAVFLPKVLRKNENGFKNYVECARERTSLARMLGRAAAEVAAWQAPSPGTRAECLRLVRSFPAIEAPLRGEGEPPVPWKHIGVFADTPDAQAPWKSPDYQRDIILSDVMTLILLGVESVQWERLPPAGQPSCIWGAGGNIAAAIRWGYVAETDPTGKSKIVKFTRAPQIREWRTANGGYGIE